MRWCCDASTIADVADSQGVDRVGADVRWSAPVSCAAGFVFAAPFPILGLIAGRTPSMVVGLVLGTWGFVDTGWFVAVRVAEKDEVIEWRAPFRAIGIPRSELRGASAGWLGRAFVVELQLADGRALRAWRGPRTMKWLRSHAVEWLG
jgi:hypothetical protein